MIFSDKVPFQMCEKNPKESTEYFWVFTFVWQILAIWKSDLLFAHKGIIISIIKNIKLYLICFWSYFISECLNWTAIDIKICFDLKTIINGWNWSEGQPFKLILFTRKMTRSWDLINLKWISGSVNRKPEWELL